MARAVQTVAALALCRLAPLCAAAGGPPTDAPRAACAAGFYGNGTACTRCPADHYCPGPHALEDSGRGAAVVTDKWPCPRGSGTGAAHAEGQTSRDSCICQPGWFESDRGTDGRSCEQCPAGRYVSEWGQSSCGKCYATNRPSLGGTDCAFDIPHFWTQVFMGCMVGLFISAAVLGLGYTIPIADVSRQEGRLVITTACAHNMQSCCTPLEVEMHDTGNPWLDSAGEASNGKSRTYRAKVLSSKRLALLDAAGEPVTQQLDSSRGTIRVVLPKGLVCTQVAGLPVAAVLCIAASLFTVGCFVLAALEPEQDPLPVVVIILATSVLPNLLLKWREHRASMRTPLRREHRRFRARLLEKGPPRPCEHGADRGVTTGQLEELYEAFAPFVRHSRDANYVRENVVKPLTEADRLSFAELVGGSPVEWFVAHYRGNAFAQLLDALRKHSVVMAARETRSALSVAYWICCVSSNHWALSGQPEGDWQQASFSRTLSSAHCRGTALVLDEEALPLTRSWCLFEVLQTLRTKGEGEGSDGLLLCTSTGVLNYGEVRLDIAARVREMLEEVDLRSSGAFREEDKDIIVDLAGSDFGGIENANSLIRCGIRSALVTAEGCASRSFLRFSQRFAEDMHGELTAPWNSSTAK